MLSGLHFVEALGENVTLAVADREKYLFYFEGAVKLGLGVGKKFREGSASPDLSILGHAPIFDVGESPAAQRLGALGGVSPLGSFRPCSRA